MCEVMQTPFGSVTSYMLFVNMGTLFGVAAAFLIFWKRIKQRRELAAAILALAGSMAVGAYLSTVVRQFTYMDFGTVETLWERVARHEGNHFSGRVLAAAVCYPLFYRLSCLFLRQKKTPENLSAALDGTGFFLIIQHFFNRAACLMNGCCYGKPYGGIGSIRLLAAEVDYRVFPSQIFEMAGMFVLLLFMLLRYRKKKNVFGEAVLGFGITVFVSEFFMDQRGTLLFMGMNGIQFTALALCLISVLFYRGRGRRGGGERQKRR